MKKLLIGLLTILVLLLSIAFAESEDVLLAAEKEGAFPALNDAGFLNEGVFVYENPEAGLWRYADSSLKVEIYKKSTKKPKLVWFEAEIWCDPSVEGFRMIANDPENRMKSQAYPYLIAQKTETVFAVNSDFAHLRVAQKAKTGIIVRNGELLYEKTKAKNKSPFPNLDTLAIMPDGSWQVFWSNELTGQDYVDMGAVDVLSFGPYLIRDGELNKTALKIFGTSKAPRTGVGMVEPGHYFAVMFEGRHSLSNGCSVLDVGEKLLELGCTVGFNLDGGQSSTIVFMGKQLCQIGKTQAKNVSARKTAEILGIGHYKTVKTGKE